MLDVIVLFYSMMMYVKKRLSSQMIVELHLLHKDMQQRERRERRGQNPTRDTTTSLLESLTQIFV